MFSRKQLQVLTWWNEKSPYRACKGIICDGAVRAGKTYPLSLSFIFWALSSFKTTQNFIITGKSIETIKRNILKWLLPALRMEGFDVDHHLGERFFSVSLNKRTHYFYYFGGQDESSQDTVQGFTAAGALFDEVALMPESFVNQVTARCSVAGAKFWFNCNPGSPMHWFKEDWIDQREIKNLLHIHFLMTDNPSLPQEVLDDYQTRYTGVFYKRNILGLWVMAEGAIYDNWRDENVYTECPVKPGVFETATHDIAVDYGTSNPMVFLDVVDTGDLILVDREYYYDSSKKYAQKSDVQYADDLDEFTGGPDKIRWVVIDPSAASFRIELRNRGYRVKVADNEVQDGIRLMASLIGKRTLRVNKKCKNFITEIGAYMWDPKKCKRGEEEPIKAWDHAMDACRYWIKTLYKQRRMIDE